MSIAIQSMGDSGIWSQIGNRLMQQRHDTVYTHNLTDAANSEEATASHAP